MKILLLEPFFTGSHRRWAEELQQVSSHEIKILQLPGRHWKWRMHGGAVSLARVFLSQTWQPDLLLATDLLDLSTFLALTRHRLHRVPSILYFHENQLTYPWSATDPDPQLQRDRHYGFINFSSALAADAVWFNSGYHQRSFLSALSGYLKVLPDFRELDAVEQIREKSKVMPLGIDLKRFDSWQTPPTGPATILWNHRWEYDKNPEAFFQTLFLLKEQSVDFQLIVLGEKFRQSPAIFEQAKHRLTDRIVHFGFAREFSDYAQHLWRTDILPVTSRQDFFGLSTVEAIYCNCFPLLPARLAFPEHIPPDQHTQHLYREEEDLLQQLKHLIRRLPELREKSYQHFVSRYDWRNLGPAYDVAFSSVKLRLQ